jgi:hypothetical protein
LVLPQKIDHQDIENLDLKKKQILNQEEDFIEGCEVSGSISINRVPGKVIFTAHSKDQSFIFSDINVSHVVNHFSFGQMKQSEHLLNSKKMFTSERFPLDGLIFLTENKHTTIEHFLNVVGFDHEEKSSSSSIIFHPVERIYEFSSSTGQTLGENLLPGVFFTYDISPLVIRVVPDYTPWYRLLTSLCAVIGGVFTIIGLLDTGVFHTINSIKKKQQLGKFH